MKIEVATICEAATEHGGRLNILGVQDVLFIGKTPWTQPQLCVVFRIRYSRIESGEQHLRMNFVDVDGHSLVPSFDANMHLDIVEGVESRVTNMILNLQNVKFENAGSYSLDIALNNRHEISLPLQVVLESEREGGPVEESFDLSVEGYESEEDINEGPDFGEAPKIDPNDDEDPEF